MMSPETYARYAHTLRAAYVSLELTNRFDDQSLFISQYSEIAQRSKSELLGIGVAAMKRRLSLFDESLLGQFLDEPYLRCMWFHNVAVFVPIVNQEGREWYGESPMFNFDFMVENFIGMHCGARTIYDLGGHQGVWAMYYAIGAGPKGRVYSFEPSIINIECSALSFLINDLATVINVPVGIGPTATTIAPMQDGLLVGGVNHKLNLIRFSQIFWEPADFIKIDIEGFEYDFLKSFPIFDFCCNIHLELHVPHLESRGLNYRDVFNLIPFDRVRVRRSHGANLAEIGPYDELKGYCSLLITPKE